MMKFKKLLLFLSSFFATLESFFLAVSIFLLACFYQITTTVVLLSFACRTNLSNVQSSLRFFYRVSLTTISPQAVTNPPSTCCCFCTGRKRSFRVIGRNCPACGLHQASQEKRPWLHSMTARYNCAVERFPSHIHVVKEQWSNNRWTEHFVVSWRFR